MEGGQEWIAGGRQGSRGLVGVQGGWLGCRGPRHGVEGLVGVQKAVWLRFYWLRVQGCLDGISGRVQGLGWGSVGTAGTKGSQLGCRGIRQGCGGFGWGANGLVRVQRGQRGYRGSGLGAGRLGGIQRVQTVQQAWLGCRRDRQGSRGLAGVQIVWVGGQGGCLRFRAEHRGSWQRCSRKFLGFRGARQGAERLSRMQRGFLGCSGSGQGEGDQQESQARCRRDCWGAEDLAGGCMV